MLPVGGVPILLRVLAAVVDARPRIVVGPPALRLKLPIDAVLTTEEPPGGGPVAATAAGLAAVPAETAHVAVLGGDLPFLSPEAVSLLRLTATHSTVDGAVFVDGGGRRQLLCGVWRAAALRDRLAELDEPGGVAMRRFVETLRVTEVTWPAVTAPPWYDCDTEADLRHAQEMG
jgi:molybdopterin-guanine dinucleotide biosynthesis protein A